MRDAARKELRVTYYTNKAHQETTWWRARLKDERAAERPYHSNFSDHNSVNIQGNISEFSRNLGNSQPSSRILGLMESGLKRAKYEKTK